MTDKPSKSDWKALADKESKGRDLSRETVEGIRLETVYGPDDAIDSGYPGVAPFTRGPYATMRPLDPGLGEVFDEATAWDGPAWGRVAALNVLMRWTSRTSGRLTTAAVNRSSHSGEWSQASTSMNTVRPQPTASGFTSATVASITPSARSRWMRRQQGVCDNPTCEATSATASDASSWRMARMRRSTRSSCFISSD